jgi:hypothetical protein
VQTLDGRGARFCAVQGADHDFECWHWLGMRWNVWDVICDGSAGGVSRCGLGVGRLPLKVRAGVSFCAHQISLRACDCEPTPASRGTS